MDLSRLSAARSALTVIAIGGILAGLLMTGADSGSTDVETAAQLLMLGDNLLLIGGIALVVRLAIAAMQELLTEHVNR